MIEKCAVLCVGFSDKSRAHPDTSKVTISISLHEQSHSGRRRKKKEESC